MKIKVSLNLIFILLSNVSWVFIPLGHSQVTQEWVARYNGLGNAYDKATSVAVDGSGNVYVTGWSASSGTNYDYATIKYNSSGVQQWVARYNGPGNFIDQAYSIAVDNSGNVYVTGGSRGIGTERDFCTIKYNSNGDSLWVRRFNGPGNGIDEAISVVVDASGNVYVTGYSDGGGINTDYHTIKYDSSGIQLWASRYDWSAGQFSNEDWPHFLGVDGSGNVYVTGESSTGTGFLDMYATVKYNSSGDSLWVARYKGQGDSGLSQAYSLAVDVSGNVYVTGRSDPTSGFGFNFDILTIKYNSNGDSLWVKRYNGPGNSSDVGNSIAVDNAGNILVTGLSVTSTADYCIIKYTPSGDTLWIARYNGPVNGVDVAYSIAVDNLNNAYVTGYSVGSGSGDDYATVQYNSSGVQNWVQRYNGPGNSMDQATSLAIDGSGSVYVTGGSNGSGSGYDYATIKYSHLVGITPVSNEIPKEFFLSQNHPNPFNPTTKIRFALANSSFAKLVVYDVLGREMETLVNEQLNAGTYEADWSADKFSSGVYYYKLITGEYTKIKKMILIK